MTGTGGRRKGNFPAETTSFIGRGKELTAVREALGGARLVTVTGVGGVGKTRLALRAAEGVRARYPDGVWLVELSPLRSAEPLALAIAEALRLEDQTVRPMPEVLAEWVQDKELLLILDTCEHLVDGCVDLVADLLTVAAGLTVLCTSRQPLRVRGEHRLELGPLALPGDPQADGAEECEALALFTQRAAAAVPGLRFTGAEAAAAAEVCRRLDGLPLALELAGARLRQMSVQELADRLQQRFEVLVSDEEAGGDGATALPRHRMLRTAVGWSHELCAPLERLLWARLAVFADGFDAEAAQAVCAGGPLPAGRVPGLLDHLVDQSVVQRENRSGTERFRMLDTVREYGADWLRELSEEDDLKLCHCRYYQRLARRACAEWNTSRQLVWCERVRTEHANLCAAVDWSLDQPDRSATLEFVGATGFLWLQSGHRRDPRHRLDKALAAGVPFGPQHLPALWARGMIELSMGDREAAVVWAQRCTEVAQEWSASGGDVAALHLTANRHIFSGRPDEALSVLTGIEPGPIRPDWLGSLQLQVRLMVSFAHLLRGDAAAARAVAEEGRALSLRHGEQLAGAAAEYFLAQTELARNDIDSALRKATSALRGHAKVHMISNLALDIDVLATAVRAAGDAHRAARLLGIGQRLWDLTGRPQIGSPHLLASRQACERAIRDKTGDTAYEHAYQEGRAMSHEQAMTYATDGTDAWSSQTSTTRPRTS